MMALAHFADQAHRNDRSVVDIEDMLNGHGGDLCNEDASESIGYGRVNAHHVKLHIKLVFLLHIDAELIHPVTKVPRVVDVQQLVYVVLFDCLSLQNRYLSMAACKYRHLRQA